MAKGPPRDLVRFSPFGFSLAVAAIVLLAAGGFGAGYLWGIRSERLRASASVPATVILPPMGLPDPSASAPSAAGSSPDVTFYSELAGDSKKPPASLPKKAPQPPLSSRKESSQGTGTAPGKEPPVRKPSPSDSQVRSPEESAAATRQRGLMVQVASYPVKSQAQELRSALEREGYRCEVQEADLGPRGRWYRVRLGPFPDESQARKAMARIERERGFKGYIVP